LASAASGLTTTSAEPDFLAARRVRAAELCDTLAPPMYKGRPGWEFTDISALDLGAFAPAPANGAAAKEPIFALSGNDTASLPDGVIVTTIEQAAREHAELIERHLGSVVPVDDVFVARNGAGFRDGSFVYVPRGVVVADPISLVTVQSTSGTELDRRTLIVLEEGAQAQVWEQYLSASPDVEGVFNAVTELVLGDASRLRYVCGQDLSEKSWIFGAQRAEVGRDAALDWVALGFGSAGGRVRMETRLGGDGADARVTGAYASHGRQHIDFDTTQEHAAPHTTSDLAFRGVLTDRSTAVWKGNIIVDPGAQKTDAFQESRNLLLSKRAHADAIPGLEIQANDVRCTHAAAIAQVDPEQIFYLRTHGLPEATARRLVIDGFLAALVERFEQGAVRDLLAAALERRLRAILQN
jgi:Fe-S cluster assembly protein SufD